MALLPSCPNSETRSNLLLKPLAKGASYNFLVLVPDHLWSILEGDSVSSTQPSLQPCQGRPGVQPQTSRNSCPQALLLALGLVCLLRTRNFKELPYPNWNSFQWLCFLLDHIAEGNCKYVPCMISRISVGEGEITGTETSVMALRTSAPHLPRL